MKSIILLYYHSNNIKTNLIQKMNSLKAALGKQDKKIDKLMSNLSISKNRFSNSKSQSIWALQNDDKDVEISLDNDQKLGLLNNLLRTAYEKDHFLSSATFDRLVEDFQQQMTTSPNKSEISYYLVLEDKMTDLIDLFGKSNPSYAKYLQEFHENVQKRIADLRNKDKTIQLRNFDKLAGINNFKKKVDYLDVGGIKFDVNPRSKEKLKHETNSNEKKLNRLFSKQKDFKQKQMKKPSQQREDHDDYLLSESMAPQNESVSYSAIMSSSVAVKQRRPRKKSTKPDQFNFNKTELKSKKSVQNEEQGQKTDKAFIFFRPRKASKY